MEWSGLFGLVYGLLGGLFEFLPVSPEVHQAVFVKISGLTEPGAGMALAVHLGALMAVMLSYYDRIRKILRGRQLEVKLAKRGKRPVNRFYMLEWRWLRIAVLPVVIAAMAAQWTSKSLYRLWALAIFAVINGVVVLMPHYMPRANKDARGMSALDALLVGASSIFSFIPGVSRLGLLTAVGSMRGMDKRYCLDFACLLSIPALAVLSLGDLVTMMVQENAASNVPFLAAILAFVGAALAAFGGIRLIRIIGERSSLEGFAYYNLGLGMITLIIYLIG